jgi:serine/threonine protein kinase
MLQFETISEDAKDLITKLLKKEPHERLYPDQALKHPWFAKEVPYNHINRPDAKRSVITHSRTTYNI